jgi:hypothetical protein
MKTVDVTNLDPLRILLVQIQEIDAGIAAQEWRKMHYLRLCLITWNLNAMYWQLIMWKDVNCCQ